ncbi:MAG: ATP-binding protein [Methylococcales bacterium]
MRACTNHRAKALGFGHRGVKRARERQRIQEAISRLQQQLNTDANTLLGFLREQRPDWVKNIAKVINPDLLLREDLDPVLSNHTEGFYGVDLNL